MCFNRERKSTHQAGNVDAILLVTTAHGEKLVDWVEAMLAVSLWGSSKELDVIEDMVVVGKVVGWDDVDASVFLDLPVLSTESLSLFEKIITRELVAPICLSCFLEVTENALAGETEDGRLHHSGGVYGSFEN